MNLFVNLLIKLLDYLVGRSNSSVNRRYLNGVEVMQGFHKLTDALEADCRNLRRQLNLANQRIQQLERETHKLKLKMLEYIDLINQMEQDACSVDPEIIKEKTEKDLKEMKEDMGEE